MHKINYLSFMPHVNGINKGHPLIKTKAARTSRTSLLGREKAKQRVIRVRFWSDS